jgi:UDP-N-acetylglucosamine 4,6-dehydratase/5-epimerase
MAPQLPHRIVGIRPGEKLHEVLIAGDDSRSTLDLGHCYVIEPTLFEWSYKGHAECGKPVADDFHYGSDNNPDWLDADGLAAMLRLL